MEKQERLHVLGFVGSARRNGNTEILVDEILRGAEEAGAAVEKVLLAKHKITPCTGCDACQETGECVFKDDMPALWTRMEHSAVWVLGTPVYWWGPTAQMKAFVDRWYSKIFLPEDQAVFRGRRIILAIPLGDTDPNVARHVVGMFTDALVYLQAELYATVLAPGVNDKGQVREYPHLLEQAREAGRKAAGEGLGAGG
jgi:putative NADPH-quinone reductase